MRYLAGQVIVFFLALLPTWAGAFYTRPAGIGAVANNMMEPVGLFANFVGSGSIVIGIGFLFGALVKYRQHKRNEMAAPISTVILLFIMAVVLLLLPFAYKLTQSGVPVHF